MDNVRACTPEDLPGVARLYGKVFRPGESAVPESRQSYLHKLYFGHPWQDDRCRPLVYESAQGDIAGFIGAIPMRFSLNGERLLAAVASAFMVDPALGNPLAAARLLRAFFQAGQDLSISDTANEVSRRMWERAGGITCFGHGIRWICPLRPVQCALWALSSRYKSKVGRRLLRYPSIVADAVAGSVFRLQRFPMRRDCVQTDLQLAELRDLLAGSGNQQALRPDYDCPGLEWVISRAQEKQQYGPLYQRGVRGVDGALIGWYLYYCRRGDVARVLQFGGLPHAMDEVLDGLFRDAWQVGAVAVEARIPPGWLSALSGRGGLLLQRKPYVVAQTARRDVREALGGGDAFITRLEGDWWSRLNGDTFV